MKALITSIQTNLLSLPHFSSERSKYLNHTACAKRSGSIYFLWSNLIVLWLIKSTLKNHATPLPLRLQINIHWNFSWFSFQIPNSNNKKTVDAWSSRSKQTKKNDVGAFPRLNLYCSKSLLFGRPGFESRTLQTLRLCSFAAPCSTRSYTTSIESPITPLLGARRSRS